MLCIRWEKGGGQRATHETSRFVTLLPSAENILRVKKCSPVWRRQWLRANGGQNERERERKPNCRRLRERSRFPRWRIWMVTLHRFPPFFSPCRQASWILSTLRAIGFWFPNLRFNHIELYTHPSHEVFKCIAQKNVLFVYYLSFFLVSSCPYWQSTAARSIVSIQTRSYY